jgi:hypothetical protein
MKAARAGAARQADQLSSITYDTAFATYGIVPRFLRTLIDMLGI